jgi:homoserine kinase
MLAVTDGLDAARRVASSVSNMVENRIEGLWVRVLSSNAGGTVVTVER